MHLVKKCSRCKHIKALGYYNKNQARPDGYQTYCRPCERVNNYYRRYGLTPKEANEILSRGCEVCGTTEALRIDHCHTTGKVRGCLCNSCNIALGHLQDNPERIMRLAKYIESSKAVLP